MSRHTITLTGEETTLVAHHPAVDAPKDASNDIVLDNVNVSRAHARLLCHDGRVVLEDLGSTNRSAVNDQEITNADLCNGDIVKIGSVILKFLTGGNAEALYYEEIYRLTISDGLTGVPNRRSFDDFLEREFARAKRYERPLSLCMFDLDHFKLVNDHHGHLAGDYVLGRLASTLLTLVRREELLARYGGEEFAIVMPETGLEKAEMFGEKVRSLVESTSFVFDGATIPVTVSALPHRELLPGIRYQDRIWTPPEGLEGSQDSPKLLALDRRIIGETLRWMAGHTEQVGRLAGCTVRLSAAALSDEHLLYFVLDQLVENPTPPGKVCFEITEAAIGKHFSETQRLVHTLKEFGCQFTVSGFGKTDEGREYLSKLPMDYLKIDRLFVSDLDANPKDYALVKSANEIGHLLGLQTIAADVETQIAVERLRDIGFDYAQGPAVAFLQPIAELT